jgi:hypothetical protein
MAFEDDSGAFSPGIDNTPWLYTSQPVIDESEEMARRRKAEINARTEWEMNHVDPTWGEKRYGCKINRGYPPPPPSPSMGPRPRPHIEDQPLRPRPTTTFPSDADINTYTIEDVSPVCGLDPYNLKLLDVITARTSRLSAAINYINDHDERLSLDCVVSMAPFIVKRLREVLTTACKEEMQDNLAIINALNEHIYAAPSKPDEENSSGGNTDEGTSTDEPTVVPDEKIQVIDENGNEVQGEITGSGETQESTTPTDGD